MEAINKSRNKLEFKFLYRTENGRLITGHKKWSVAGDSRKRIGTSVFAEEAKRNLHKGRQVFRVEGPDGKILLTLEHAVITDNVGKSTLLVEIDANGQLKHSWVVRISRFRKFKNTFFCCVAPTEVGAVSEPTPGTSAMVKKKNQIMEAKGE